MHLLIYYILIISLIDMKFLTHLFILRIEHLKYENDTIDSTNLTRNRF